MKEEIEKVLSDETYTTNEERVEAITKSLATLVIPKNKYNDLNTKYKTMEDNFNTLSNEYDNFKKNKMTDDEKREADLKKLEADKKSIAINKSELAVKSLLLDNGIQVTDDDIELKETLSNIISDDYEKSVKLANSFISILKKTQDTTAKKTVTDLLNDTPTPKVNNTGEGSSNKMEEYKTEYEEAVKSGDLIGQAQYMRLVQEEQQKLSKNI